MCGITGWINWERDLEDERAMIEKMTMTLAHRGPDGAGIYLNRHIALGHRRLSIIDLERGKQPMTRKAKCNTFTIVYNGELYNTEEIRHELKSKGYYFESHSDTEVLIYAFIEWGSGCLKKLNGIFAFAVWDEREEKLFLARDRFGVKPLFYTFIRNQLIFGSEIKALLAHPLVKAEVDSEGLAELLSLSPSRTPGHGVFRNIKELRPGTYATFDRKGLAIGIYWLLESLAHEDNLATTTERVRELVVDAIERQLVSDVPVCTFLSGGLDSSAITAVASKYYRQNGLGKLMTFSLDYIDNDRYFQASDFQPNADSEWIGKAVAAFATKHHYIYFDTPQLVENLADAVYYRDLPGMADIDSSLYLFCREIKKHATVALSGECADEVFGGYPWFYQADQLEAEGFPWIRNIEERLRILSPEVTSVINPIDYAEFRYEQTLKEVPLLTGESPLEARRRIMAYLNFTWFMATLLDRKDRMSMGTGLEVRVPFCDHKIVEYVWNIPWEMKFFDKREKGILRKALSGMLPDDILWRKKSPYPKTHNPSYLQAVRKELENIINNSQSPLNQIINVKYIKELLKSDLKVYNTPWFGQLMTGPQLFAFLIQVDLWLRKYKVVMVL
ncbi:MAG: asparagine synthase [Clostridiaceae bacterium BRH_c20a]|nr:MAG: asparagine synthase [Clostridiaceae bacterium BRH_c20a]